MIDLLQMYEQAGLMMRRTDLPALPLADQAAWGQDGADAQPLPTDTLNELPDHLTVVLEYASTQPPAQAREFLGEISHILQAIHQALAQRQSDYAPALAAVLELAGVEPLPLQPELAAPSHGLRGLTNRLNSTTATTPEAASLDPQMDAEWAEPEAFGGCPSQSLAHGGGFSQQTKHPQTQPIQIVRTLKTGPSPAAPTHGAAS